MVITWDLLSFNAANKVPYKLANTVACSYSGAQFNCLLAGFGNKSRRATLYIVLCVFTALKPFTPSSSKTSIQRNPFDWQEALGANEVVSSAGRLRKSGVKRPIIGHLCLFSSLLMATPRPDILAAAVSRRQIRKESRPPEDDGLMKAFTPSRGKKHSWWRVH